MVRIVVCHGYVTATISLVLATIFIPPRNQRFLSLSSILPYSASNSAFLLYLNFESKRLGCEALSHSRDAILSLSPAMIPRRWTRKLVFWHRRLSLWLTRFYTKRQRRCRFIPPGPPQWGITVLPRVILASRPLDQALNHVLSRTTKRAAWAPYSPNDGACPSPLHGTPVSTTRRREQRYRYRSCDGAYPPKTCYSTSSLLHWYFSLASKLTCLCVVQ
jgi:hypothetical protein